MTLDRTRNGRENNLYHQDLPSGGDARRRRTTTAGSCSCKEDKRDNQFRE